MQYPNRLLLNTVILVILLACLLPESVAAQQSRDAATDERVVSGAVDWDAVQVLDGSRAVFVLEDHFQGRSTVLAPQPAGRVEMPNPDGAQILDVSGTFELRPVEDHHAERSGAAKPHMNAGAVPGLAFPA